MDELDLLKKDWKKQDAEHKKLSVTDIYPMLHKKSSSIVKTLLYISIAELLFWILVNTIPYIVSDSYRSKLETMYANTGLFTALTIFSYAVILLFIYLLFKAYKSISVTDNAKRLMESILKTRKIIKYYVLYNLIMAGISLIIGFYFTFTNDPKVMSKISHFNDKQMLFLYGFMFITITIFVAIIWLFYKLIYGWLLKRLNRNYKELKKLEV
ncbi:hypothetical protein [Changchengzhania lutea]|uniref:hypothetical protein n=1 Tax=Changchengzhania lutea TaxID=2049305 RepID=UPI00115EEF58|nr:hypothetical protein [Changchengzhania lutea]